MSEFLREITEVRENADLIYDEVAMTACYDHLAEKITENLIDNRPLFLPVMMGGIYLCGQLMQRLDFPLEVDYLHATRYRDKLQGNDLHWLVHPSGKVAGRTVLVIDDILDQGLTLAGIVENLQKAGAAEVQSVVLTVKQCPRIKDVDVTYRGVDVPDRYVFGCGMDYRGYWRNLPQIYAVADS
ncbi:MAG: hypoxanthine-guanine phosphoribosyltransferase [Gammaproteobacteria bacterium]|nr:hypoxanthine-guanine phosphoribosyltransferase [Gammaproteobacteria bacterium]